MIHKPCTEIYVDLENKVLQEKFVEIATKRFTIINNVENADIIVSDKESNTKKLQVIVDSNQHFKCSKDNVIYFQPFLYNKQGSLDDCADSLFWMCVYKAWNMNAPLKIENTILLLC